MSALTIDQIVSLLRDYVRQADAGIDLLLVGGLALQAYGMSERATLDVDAEIEGDLERLAEFLAQHGIASDLSENFSGWAVVSMPQGYRDRATIYLAEPRLRVRLLAPLDFVISKLRRGTEIDLDDAAFIAKRFGIAASAVQAAAQSALESSPKDTALFVFRKTVDLFCRRLT